MFPMWAALQLFCNSHDRVRDLFYYFFPLTTTSRFEYCLFTLLFKQAFLNFTVFQVFFHRSYKFTINLLYDVFMQSPLYPGGCSF